MVYAVNGAQLEARSQAGGTRLWTWSPGEPTTDQFTRFTTEMVPNSIVVTRNMVLVSSSTRVCGIDLATRAVRWTSFFRHAAGAKAIRCVTGDACSGRTMTVRWSRSAGALIDRPPSSTLSPISAIWVTHMKTTIELPDDLLERGKAVARRENSTLKALIEEGLRLALRERARARKRTAPFAVQPFQGDGLSPEFADSGWERIRDEIYRDRG